MYKNRIIGVLLISLLWVAVLTIGVLLAWLFSGGEFLIRTILLCPFSIGGVFATHNIWIRYYEKDKLKDKL